MHSSPDIVTGHIHNQIRLLLIRRLIRVIDTSETLDLTSTSSLVNPALVRLLAVLERRSDVHEVEGSVLLDHLAGRLAGSLEGSNGACDDSGAGTGKLGGNEADTLDILVAVFVGEAEFGGELAADRLSEEERDGAAALLVEGDVERAGDGVFAGVGVASQEDGKALLVARRVGFAEHADDFGVGEPFRDVAAGAETAAELGAGDVEGLDLLWNFVFGSVLIGVGQVGHLLELDDFDAELVLVLLDGVLGVVWAIDFLAFAVLAWAGVVTADDEVGGAVVLADDGVPDGFAGTAHTHSEREKTEDGHAVGVAGQEGLVDTDTGEVVDVTWLRHADHRVDEDVGLALAGGADGQLTMSTMHWVPGLEGHDARPAEFVEVQTKLSGGVAETNVVVVHEAVNGLDLAADVVVAGNLKKVLDSWVIWVTAKDLLGLLLLVWLVYVVHCHDSQIAVITGVTERDTLAGLDSKLVNVLLLEVEADWHGEEVAIRESVLRNHTIVVLLVHEALERGEASVQDKLDIAQLAVVEDDGREGLGLLGQFLSSWSIAGNQVLEDAAVGWVGHVGWLVVSVEKLSRQM